VPETQAGALREKLRALSARNLFDTTPLRITQTARCFAMSLDSPTSTIAVSRSGSFDGGISSSGRWFRFIEHNRAGQEIVLNRGQERPPRDGYQVHLTIDS